MASTLNADNGSISGSSGLKSSADASGVLALQTNGTTALTIDTSQNVGVGTSSPSYRLHAYKNTDGVIAGFQGPNRTLTYAEYSGVSYMWNSGADFYFGTATANPLILGTNNTERMRIDSSGNVGIGTTSPAYKLQTNGTVAVSTNSGTAPIFLLNQSGVGAGQIRVPVSVNALAFDYFNGSVLTEGMRLDGSGNLLVGTTSALNFAASNVTGIQAAPNYLAASASGTTGLYIKRYTSTGEMVGFWYGLNQVGSITTSGSATAYNTSSDYRLKENIAPMQNALGVVQQLNPVTYTWKADGSDGQGFIAHELQAVVPDCVTGEKDAVDAEGKPVYQGIDTSFLVATLTAAIQELKAEIDSLKAQISG